jgi:hypothetical protein
MDKIRIFSIITFLHVFESFRLTSFLNRISIEIEATFYFRLTTYTDFLSTIKYRTFFIFPKKNMI